MGGWEVDFVYNCRSCESEMLTKTTRELQPKEAIKEINQTFGSGVLLKHYKTLILHLSWLFEQTYLTNRTYKLMDGL